MSKVIPSKLVPSGKAPMGLLSMKEIDTEIVRLLPNNANSSQVYTPASNNRIYFRIPAYGNSFLDTSRSFLSFSVKNTTTATESSSAGGKNFCLSDVGGSWIQRMVIKTSSGLTLEDISDYNVLRKVLQLLDTDEEFKGDEHNFSSLTGGQKVQIAEMDAHADYTPYVVKFNTGLLSQHLKSALPIFLMDKGGFAFDIEIFLSNSIDCMTYQAKNPVAVVGGFKPDGTVYDASSAATANALRSIPASMNPSYEVKDIAFNLYLLKVDEAICKKYDKIACEMGEKIIIPFTTYKSHKTALTAQKQTVFVSEACNDLQRLFMVVHDNVNTKPQATPWRSTEPFAFKGAIGSAIEVNQYQFRVGNKNIFNEDVQETRNNNVTLNHFLNNTYHHSKHPKPNVCKFDSTTLKTNFESKDQFVLSANFTYSDEAKQGVSQGISTQGLPIQAHVQFNTQPNHTSTTFAECAYQLIIENGAVSYAENHSPKDGWSY